MGFLLINWSIFNLKMKTLTFILYFVAILGLIEANWRVIENRGFSRQEQSNFKRYVRSALSRDGYYGDMEFLSRKIGQEQGGDWVCFHGNFAGYCVGFNKTISVRKGTNTILCFD